MKIWKEKQDKTEGQTEEFVYKEKAKNKTIR